MINTTIPPDALFDKEALAKLLELSSSTILREVNAGRLRGCKRAGKYFFLAEHVKQWLEAGNVNGRNGDGNGEDTK